METETVQFLMAVLLFALKKWLIFYTILLLLWSSRARLSQYFSPTISNANRNWTSWLTRYYLERAILSFGLSLGQCHVMSGCRHSVTSWTFWSATLSCSNLSSKDSTLTTYSFIIGICLPEKTSYNSKSMCSRICWASLIGSIARWLRRNRLGINLARWTRCLGRMRVRTKKRIVFIKYIWEIWRQRVKWRPLSIQCVINRNNVENRCNFRQRCNNFRGKIITSSFWRLLTHAMATNTYIMISTSTCEASNNKNTIILT